MVTELVRGPAGIGIQGCLSDCSQTPLGRDRLSHCLQMKEYLARGSSPHGCACLPTPASTAIYLLSSVIIRVDDISCGTALRAKVQEGK